MKLNTKKCVRVGRVICVCLALFILAATPVRSQGVTTTTVQGTVYLANGQPGAGTLMLSWPAFNTASNQAVAAGSLTVTIGSDGFLSVNLAPNQGSSPGGLYYTAVFHMSDGTVSTEYWVVPQAASASLASVQTQVMPAAQAVQAVTKSYVDQLIQQLETNQLSGSGGTLTGPLYLSGDPTSPLQAADKHYVDQTFAQAVPLTGGTMSGALNAPALNGVGSPVAGGAQTTLQSTVNANSSTRIPPNYAGSDTFTNTNGEYVEDMRTGVAQQFERNVKEFGAVCDGTTDDTSALQSAINYAYTHNVALKLPQGICKTQTLTWHGESISGMGKQVSGLKGFPGQDILATLADNSVQTLTKIRDLTFYVDQSVDVSCMPAAGRDTAGSCTLNRPLEVASVFSSGGNALTGTNGTGNGWAVGNCAIAMPAATGTLNGLKLAQFENIEITTTGTDPLSASYPGIYSTHACGLYFAQWPQWSEFKNIDINGLNTGIAVGAPTGGVPANTAADGNRWENITMQVTHGFTAVAGNNNVIDNLIVLAGTSSASGEPPTGLVLDFARAQQGWSVRNSAITPTWISIQPKLTITASSGAVTAVSVGPDHGLGFDPYGSTVPLTFTGACTAQANANVNNDGSISSVTVVSGGIGCSGSTAATINVPGTYDTSAPVNLIAGRNLFFEGGSLQSGNGGFTIWNATSSQVNGVQITGGGVTASGTSYAGLLLNDGLGSANSYNGSANKFTQIGLTGSLKDNGLGNSIVQTNATTGGSIGLEASRTASNTTSADFALLGGGTSNQAFSSLNDLFLSADDLWYPGGESGGTGSQFGKDSSAPVTGSYVKAINGAWNTSGTWHVRGTTNPFVLGSGFPAGTGTWYVAAKADNATTQELKLAGTYGSGSVCVFADKVLSLTTSWQVFSIPYNSVTGNSTCDNGTAGNPVTAQGLAPAASTNVYTAWTSFVPAFQQILLTQQPTQANQVANKAYVDAAVSGQIVSGSGLLPISGGTMTGPLNTPVLNKTTNCALSSSVSNCIASAQSALIPPTTTGTYTQQNAQQATADCVYDIASGGTIIAVNPGSLGYGYVSTPAVSIYNSGSGGSGLAITPNVVGGQVTSYTINNHGSGYTSCPGIAVAAPASPSAPVPVLDQRRGMTTYSNVVRVDDFGCAADGVTDDTICINNAINYATNNGTTGGAISFTGGKNYFVSQITGYMATASDDGTAPSTGDTCSRSNAANSISGSTCTNLQPETPGQLGFAIRAQNYLTIFGNGAAIVSNFPANSTSFSLAAPDIAIFGSDAQVTNFTVKDLNISYAFIAFSSPGYAAYWNFDNVSTGNVAISVLTHVLQLSTMNNITFKGMAGIVVGGWWSCRSYLYNCASSGDFADNIVIQNYKFYGYTPSVPVSGVVANQAALDNWFNTYFFHTFDNTTRMTDNTYAAAGVDTDSFYRGIYGIGVAYYSRYGRASYDNYIFNMIDKEGMSYPILIQSPVENVIDSLSGESVGVCLFSPFTAWGAPGVCPNPYDTADNQLEAAILTQNPAGLRVRNVNSVGINAESVVGLSWRQNLNRNLAVMRENVSTDNSYIASYFAPNIPQPETQRNVLWYSGNYPANGISDSGENCYVGVVSGGSGIQNDEVCERYASATYQGTSYGPRYFVIENEGYSNTVTGPFGVQSQGLRIRPGLISNTDNTLMVSDFASQAFAIASGSVSANSCSTISGINLPGSATTDGVLFIKPPSTITPLQPSGIVTAAGTFSLTLCNPTSGAISYPSGTYSAFLLNNASPASTPATSGNAPTAVAGLTSNLGDLVTASSSGTPIALPGNTTTSTAVLTETGTGSLSSAPVWSTAPALSGVNITGLSASNINTGTVAITNGGTGASTAAQALTNLGGVSLNTSNVDFTGQVTAKEIGGVYQADQFGGADLGAMLNACVTNLNSTYGGVCDARNLTGAQTMGSNLTISTANTTIYLPCATISTSNQIIVTAGTRNVVLHGCSLRGASTASGSQGGTVLNYAGNSAAIQVGDPNYLTDTMGFKLDNVAINVTGSSNAATKGFIAFRTQELHLESLYFLGNANQTGITLDGTGNYTGGSFIDLAFNGFQQAVNAIGHQISNAATTDWMNASAFLRLHIDCPTSSGSPISGTYGINLQQGDGNTFTGGDVEGCSTALHLGANAVNNTIVGLRNENSTNQIVADSGSSYNSWITGGTMFTGALTDNGTRNSFLDSFHRSFNGLNGDWYGSQKDATVTNHYRLGTGAGNERGLLNRYQSDFGYRWTMGLSDATAGEQFYQILDELNSVYRLSIGQYNNGASSANNQTVINSAGTGAVVLNGSNNAGTGGVIFGSGGATETTIATIDGSGNATFTGTLTTQGVTTHQASVTVKNQADAEIDSTLWAGLTTAQKEAFIYKDWSGASQWYLVKDASNNWAVNSATSGIDSFKAYQSTNSGDTYVNANASGTVRINYEANSGTAFNIYSGGASPSLIASFTGTTSIKYPGLAASTGHNCLQIDNTGFITNTGAACGTSSGSVTSVGLSMPADFTISGSPVTASGTLTATYANEAQNTVHAGPASGGAGVPTWRTLVSADLPVATTSALGAVKPDGTTITIASGVLSAVSASQLNGASLPASANSLATNSSSQIVAATTHNLSVPANCVAASASGTAYTCSTSPTFTPATGDHIQFKADVANTGTATLAVNGATAATIKKWGGSGNLIANDLLAGHWVSATFDGANWQLEGQLGNANSNQLNGSTVPASAAVLSSNASSQLAAAATTGSGSVVLATSPSLTTPTLGVATATSLTTSANSTLGGSANTFFNNVAATENDLIVEGGTTGSQGNAAFELATPAGAAEWKLKMDTSNYLHLSDVVNSLDRQIFYQNGNTNLNAGAGANAVVINSTTNSGTGGLIVYSGGATPTTQFTVTGAGAVTSVGTMTNAGLATNTAGTGTIGTATKWFGAPIYFSNSASFYVGLTTATPTANYTLTIPTLTANDTLDTLGLAQTISGAKTFTGATTVNANFTVSSGHTLGLNSTVGFGQTALASVYMAAFGNACYSAGTGTTNFPCLVFNPGATAVTTWSTGSGGTFVGFNAASGFAGNFLDAHTNGGASLFTVNSSGGVLATGHGNQSSLTIAAGAAAGTSPTIACATNVTCGWNGGTINLLTGTAPTTGALLTVTDTTTHAKYPSCTYQIYAASSSYVPNGTLVTTGYYPTNTSFTVETLNLSAALTASSYYVINYTCSGI